MLTPDAVVEDDIRLSTADVLPRMVLRESRSLSRGVRFGGCHGPLRRLLIGLDRGIVRYLSSWLNCDAGVLIVDDLFRWWSLLLPTCPFMSLLSFSPLVFGLPSLSLSLILLFSSSNLASTSESESEEKLRTEV